MKKYSVKIRNLKKIDDNQIKFVEREAPVYGDDGFIVGSETDVLMTSEEFLTKYKVFIDDIALFKEIEGRKRFRSQEYASIGIMDRNDLIQEAYLSFLNAYNDVNWKKINKSTNPEAALWGYLKKKTILDLNRGLRQKKDGIRITEWKVTQSKEAKGSVNVEFITTLFNKIEHIFFRNQEDTALTKYETDLLGYFLDVHLDEFLDLNFKGERNWTGIERDVIRMFYGIESARLTTKEIAKVYHVSDSTIKNVVKRSLAKLRTKESMTLIANFCHEYFISTNSLAREYAVNQGLTN